MDSAVRIEDLQEAYRCTFSDDGKTVTIVFGTQLIPALKLEFGTDLPKDGRVGPEHFSVLLEAAVHGDRVMIASAKIELFSPTRQQHAKFRKTTDAEEFLSRLTRQVIKLTQVRRKQRAQPRPVTRTPLEALADQIGDETLKGETGSKGSEFVKAWLDKNLANAGDSAETAFLTGALQLYRKEHARRHRQQEEEVDSQA